MLHLPFLPAIAPAWTAIATGAGAFVGGLFLPSPLSLPKGARMSTYVAMAMAALTVVKGAARCYSIEHDTSLSDDQRKEQLVAEVSADLPALAGLAGVPAALAAEVATPAVLGGLYDAVEAVAHAAEDLAHRVEPTAPAA